MMLKFKGKPWELKLFILYLMHQYGEEITLKKLIQKLRGEN